MVLCQDEHLDDISSALDRLGKVAIVINDEVDDQNRCVRCAMCWWGDCGTVRVLKGLELPRFSLMCTADP